MMMMVLAVDHVHEFVVEQMIQDTSDYVHCQTLSQKLVVKAYDKSYHN
jgi:hypothetical protein